MQLYMALNYPVLWSLIDSMPCMYKFPWPAGYLCIESLHSEMLSLRDFSFVERDSLTVLMTVSFVKFLCWIGTGKQFDRSDYSRKHLSCPQGGSWGKSTGIKSLNPQSKSAVRTVYEFLQGSAMLPELHKHALDATSRYLGFDWIDLFSAFTAQGVEIILHCASAHLRLLQYLHIVGC